jgi:type III secretory pathway component EscV
MESSDYIYGFIFALYIALFVVVGGYALTRRRIAVDKVGQEEQDETATASSDGDQKEKKSEQSSSKTRGKKKAE